MNTKQDVDDFLASKTVAVVGLSRDTKSFSVMASRKLREAGFELTGVTPAAQEIDGVSCYPSLSDLPKKPDGLIFFTQPPITLQILGEADKAGIRHVWIQQGAENDAVLDFCETRGLAAVAQQCIMMFAPPVTGLHGFHRWINKVSSKLPV